MKTLSLLILVLCASHLHAQYSVQQDWVWQYAAGLAPGDDGATAIAFDNQTGDVFVTGYLSSPEHGQDYYTARYNHSGQEIWSAIYNGPADGNDRAISIAIDLYSNVYVTGSSLGLDGTLDYATVKYDLNGEEKWVVRYAGPNNSIEEPAELAVDKKGNVVVIGTTRSLPGAIDSKYLTIKYNSSGMQIWSAKHEVDGSVARNLKIDVSGNIYVTGNFATIKYNENGIVQWTITNIASAPIASLASSAIAVDISKNVYLTGWSTNLNGRIDYVTLKYDSSGTQQWLVEYDGPGHDDDVPSALAVDDSGNVYVAGYSIGSGTAFDYATVKYDRLGNQRWVARYNGPGNGHDRAAAIEIDSSGNILVSGSSVGDAETGRSYDIATVKYNATGQQLWVARYDGVLHGVDQVNSLAIGREGKTYVAGKTEGASRTTYEVITTFDFVIMGYNQSGTQEWIHPKNGPASFDRASALAHDGFGNFYISGLSQRSGARDDFAMIKLNDAGGQLWVARYDGSLNFFDQPVPLAVDQNGNSYITGTVDGNKTATIKYDTHGVQQWATQFSRLADYYQAVAISSDTRGNVYLSGHSFASNAHWNYTTVKYNSAGVEEWVAVFDGSGNYHDYVSGLAVDKKGNVYVTGTTYTFNPEARYFSTIKYNTNGTEEWVATYKFTLASVSRASAIALDDSGNVYITGSNFTGNTGTDFITIKYNNAGEEQWIAQYNSNGQDFDDPTGLAVDNDQNVYVTGISFPQGYSTVKYDSFGNEQWVAKFELKKIFRDVPSTKLALDMHGNAYVTGLLDANVIDGTLDNFVTIKYDPAGEKQWEVRFNKPGYSNDHANGIVVNNDGSIIVSGWSEGNGWSVYTVVKYTQSPVSVEEDESSSPHIFHLAQNYPNPFNPSTTIRYALARTSRVTLKIFNLSGQEVATLVDEIKSQGAHEVQWEAPDLPCGMYFCRLQAGNEFVQARKLLLLK